MDQPLLLLLSRKAEGSQRLQLPGGDSEKMQAMAVASVASKQPLTDQEQNLQCPRCDSANTKFCYYNNYNLSQPRYFCKDCRRYWTKGGCLRNIPVGGGTRKSSKRSCPASAGNVKRMLPPSSSAGEVQKSHIFPVPFPPINDDRRWLDINGSFSSLLSSDPQFMSYLECNHSLDSLTVLRSPPTLEPDLLSSGESARREGSSLSMAAPPPFPENLLSLPSDATGWVGSWPELSIYTPGTSFS